ncbi:hypothetical protein AURDEDRAFT_178429 [Auricularia subglabra TFB-10046 SS5]|uniref:Uncharacterized protein n=1 Tax=Auricularia subglabra (strain TFB-10046 / SS5) TaxID=717982 RepID=J0WJP6_AURST|nr:hypothetical protein AURDEDRAFT_178429 [Auricularia subglabra TFB-10046 SS5]
MARNKSWDDLSPYFNVPDELLDQMRPLLYHLALTSPAKEDSSATTSFVNKYLLPRWKDLQLDDPAQHPSRYGEQETRKTVRSLRRPRRADMEAMYAAHPELEPVTDLPEPSPPETDDAGDRSQSPGAHQEEPAEREVESTEKLKEWKRAPMGRELYADDIDDELQLAVEQVLDGRGRTPRRGLKGRATRPAGVAAKRKVETRRRAVASPVSGQGGRASE